MAPSPTALKITLDPAWSAEQMAEAILAIFRDAYGQTLEIDAIQSSMEEIWHDLHEDLTADERQRIGMVTHISVPMNDLGAAITAPPSRNGYFVIFDAMLDIRLWEIFSAPRNEVAWAACYARAAWGNHIRPADWVGPAISRLSELDRSPVPDSYSIGAARDFVFAHECGHFFLNHLDRGLARSLPFDGLALTAFAAEQADELAADMFARDVLCRSRRRPLVIQQMGVDWLFGFLGAVLGMRRRARAIAAGHLNPPEAMHAGLAARRAVAWKDYNRRRSVAAQPTERSAENVMAVERVRMSVDNFNAAMPAALAEIYAAYPADLMDWQDRVTTAAMRDEDVGRFKKQLVALAHRTLAVPTAGRWRRWRQKIMDLF